MIVSTRGQSPQSLWETRRVWSLRDMLKFNAASFYKATTALQAIRIVQETQPAQEIAEHEDGSVSVHFVTDNVARGVLRRHARDLYRAVVVLGTNVTAYSVRRLLEEIEKPNGFTWSAIAKLCSEIDSRLTDELNSVNLLLLRPTGIALYDPPDPLFGADFDAKFPTDGGVRIR